MKQGAFSGSSIYTEIDNTIQIDDIFDTYIDIYHYLKKFESLQLCSPLRHMDKWYLFGSLQSHTVWSQMVMVVARLLEL